MMTENAADITQLITLIQRDRTMEALRLLNHHKFRNIDSQIVTRGSHCGGSALFWAATRGSLVLIEMLLFLGASVHVSTAWGGTPLHGAAEGGHVEVIQYLLRYGADANEQTINGDTPTHLAAYRGHKKVVEVLLMNGADITIRNNSSRNCLHEAYLQGHYKLVEDIKRLVQN